MLTHPGHHIGDSWFFVHNQTAHCFYLCCPDLVKRHSAWNIGHATSRDLVDWQIHDLALLKGAPGEWDGVCPATGSVIEQNGRFWMAYTGNHAGPNPSVGLAVSDDLFSWQKCEWNPVTRPDARFYELRGSGARDMEHWRDPYLFRHDGWIYHCVCASRRDGARDERGTVGLARTRDWREWQVLPPPDVQGVAQELEVPQIRQVGEQWYLLFCTHPHLWSAAWRAQHREPTARSSNFAMVAPSPFGPFKLKNPAPIVPFDHPAQPYAAQIVEWRGKHYLLGTLWRDGEADAICDPIEVAFTSDGIAMI